MFPDDDDARSEEPLDEADREQLRQDLVDVETLKELLGPREIRGVLFFCADCEEDHYLAWDLLKGNLQELLNEGESPVHEPAFNPNPDEYVTWDYARGFLDGYETLQDEDLEGVTVQLVAELQRRGWSQAQTERLLNDLGLEVSGWAFEPPSDGTR
jgi:hypothetical protein